MAGQILLASLNPASRSLMQSWLGKIGFSVESVSTFEAARDRLTSISPEVLVTDARLGEFNGLHLAIVGRTRRPALVAIVIGATDLVLAREAERHGATYLSEPVTEEELVAQVTMLLQEVGRHRRWPRKYVPDTVDAEFGQSAARILDLSYGGLRMEVVGGVADAPGVGSDVRLHLPAFGVSVDAALIWVEPGSSGQFQCGAALANPDPVVASQWRYIVDRVGLSLQ